MNELEFEDLPEVGDRDAIALFARSFNGYQHFGSFKACAQAAHAKARSSLLDLRNELFFSFRASNHLGTEDFVDTYLELHPYFVAMVRAEKSSDTDKLR